MLVVTLAMVACASTRTQKSAGEQVDDSVTTAEREVGPDRRSGDQGAPDRRRSVQGHRSAERLRRLAGEQGTRHGSCQEPPTGVTRSSQQPYGGDRDSMRVKRLRRRRRHHHQGEGGARRGSAHQGAPDQRRDPAKAWCSSRASSTTAEAKSTAEQLARAVEHVTFGEQPDRRQEISFSRS